MDYRAARRRLAIRLQTLRAERGLTQEKLAELIGKSTEHVSFLERGERSPSFEALLDLASALRTSIASLLGEGAEYDEIITEAIGVAPIVAPLLEPTPESLQEQARRLSDLERLNEALNGIREMQKLADEYGIHDILQDNGGKTLQVLILLGLKLSPGREGNDAIDAGGNEYELKTVNRSLNKNAGITTHHHLNREILQKYRTVKAWYVAIYEGVELKEIYRLSPSDLETLFAQWEERIGRTGFPLNNPKIPMRLVRDGRRVYSTEALAPDQPD